MHVVVEYVESKPTATLDGAMISLQNVRSIPHQWNSLPVKEECHRFVE